MPHYDYVCKVCGHQAEIFQKMSDAALTRCPKCRKAKFERQIGGGAGVIFKGSGFYETDYRSDSWKADAAKDTPCSGTPAQCTKPSCPSKN